MHFNLQTTRKRQKPTFCTQKTSRVCWKMQFYQRLLAGLDGDIQASDKRVGEPHAGCDTWESREVGVASAGIGENRNRMSVSSRTSGSSEKSAEYKRG